MIPKIVHRVWFGGEMPSKFAECVEQQEQFLEGYEKLWWGDDDLDGLMDVPTVRRYAGINHSFVSDYVRMWALYRFGGIYIDCDLKMNDTFNKVLHLKRFIGLERVPVPVQPSVSFNGHTLTSAIIGVEAGDPYIKQVLDALYDRDFWEDDYTITTIMTAAAKYMRRTRLVNTIREAEVAEAAGIFPVFNAPGFDNWHEALGRQDYCFCDHHYFNSWIPNHGS